MIVRRRSCRLLAVAVAALLGLAVSGCGIPTETDVRIDERGPAYSGSGPLDGIGREPPRRESSDDVEQFVRNFLQAAAGEAAGAYDRVNEYIPRSSNRLRPRQGSDVAINVVRLTEAPRVTANPDGTNSVQVAVQQVGVLRPNGSITEPVATETEYTLTVGKLDSTADGRSETSKGFYVLDPPQTLLMSTDALKDYYRTRTIYFWNSDRTALVPDLRYLPVAVPSGRVATEVLGWLTGGPAAWLGATAVPLPEGTKAIGNVPAAGPDGRLVVNLSVQAGEVDDEAELNRLFTQLAWSLREDIKSELELKIEHESRKIADAGLYRRDNPVYRVSGVPGRFCVHAGQVRPLAYPGQTSMVPLPSAMNRDVVSAGLTREQEWVWAALVTASGRDRYLRVGAGIGAVNEVIRVGGTYTSMSRPVWLKGSDPAHPVGLVVADGRLYRFGLDGRMTEMPVPNLPGSITAVAVALDGHRIAVISGGALYVAALAIDGDSVAIGGVRRLVGSLHELSAVDWSEENFLLTAGLNGDGRVEIHQISVDSGLAEPVVSQVPADTVSHLAAYPTNPIVSTVAGNPMYEGNGVAYAAGQRIDRSQVGPVEGLPAPPESGNPTAPFFLY